MIHRAPLCRFTARLVAIVRLAALLALVGAMAMPGSQAVAAVTQPDLLTATSFSVLAATTVTNTGPTIIGPPVSAPVLGGDLGVSPGAAVVGFPPGNVLPPGVIHAADAVALQAQTDTTTAYNTLAGETPCTALPASVGTLTLTPGVYCFTSAALFTMPSLGLTLDLQGDPNSLFVFQIPSQLTTEPGYPVNFINGSAPCNVWWQVGSSATLGTTTQFVGNILALASISLDTGATLSPGRALARTGAVTLDTNTINMAGCPAQLPPTNTQTPPPTAPLAQSSSLPSSSILYEIAYDVTALSSPGGSPATDSSGPIVLHAGEHWSGSPTPVLGSNGQYYIELFLVGSDHVFVPVGAVVNVPTTTLPTTSAPTSLPVTGYPPADADRPDNRLPIVVAGGLLLLAAGAWRFRPWRKVR